MTTKNKIIKSLGEPRMDIVDNLKYFISMPFKAQFKEDDYFKTLRPLYHEDTGLYANNSCELFKWALQYVK